MRIIGTITTALALAGLGAGCCSCGPKLGWSFQVGKPATVSAEALVSPALTSYGVGGVAALPAAGVVAAAPVAMREPCPPPQSLLQPPRQAAPDPCAGISVEELCRRVIALEARLRAQGLPKAAEPMPKGE